MRKYDTKKVFLGHINDLINNLKQLNSSEIEVKKAYKNSKDKLIKPNL